MKRLLLGSLIAACLSASLSSCHSVLDEGQEEVCCFSFREPLTNWSASSEEVQDYMTGYSMVSKSDYSLVYEGKDSENSYLYAFSGLTNTLNYAVVAFLVSQKSEAILFLEKNYTKMSEQDGSYVFINKSNDTAITATSDETVFRVTYMNRAYMAK